jgi:hypothetical protein
MVPQEHFVNFLKTPPSGPQNGEMKKTPEPAGLVTGLFHSGRSQLFFAMKLL